LLFERQEVNIGEPFHVKHGVITQNHDKTLLDVQFAHNGYEGELMHYCEGVVEIGGELRQLHGLKLLFVTLV
jgi:hypothetical protein